MAEATKKKSTKKAQSAAIQERAMLVKLKASIWGGGKTDAAKTQEVLSASRALEGAGSWFTRTVAPVDLKQVNTVANQARNTHQQMTLPWSDTGFRILPASMFLEHSRLMREHREKFYEAVDKFIEDFPNVVERAKERLGDLFDEAYYPTPEELRQRFKWKVAVMPVPDAGDFRVDLEKETAEEVRKDIEDEIRESIDSANRDLWRRMYESLGHLVERLSGGGVIRDSVIKNVTNICDLVPKMNVADDKELDEMRKQVLQQVSAMEPEQVRRNEDVRKDAHQKTKAILDKMQATMGTS